MSKPERGNIEVVPFPKSFWMLIPLSVQEQIRINFQLLNSRSREWSTTTNNSLGDTSTADVTVRFLRKRTFVWSSAEKPDCSLNLYLVTRELQESVRLFTFDTVYSTVGPSFVYYGLTLCRQRMKLLTSALIESGLQHTRVASFPNDYLRSM